MRQTNLRSATGRMGLEILLIDDGEIEVARSVLSELELEFEDWRASKLESPARVPPAVRLLITTARFAAQMQPRRPEQLAGNWIAVVEGDSQGQRTALRKAGFDYLIPSQSHAAVVRVSISAEAGIACVRVASPLNTGNAPSQAASARQAVATIDSAKDWIRIGMASPLRRSR